MRKYHEVPNASEIKEKEKVPETKVILHFFRHEEKEGDGPGHTGIEVALTKRGKENAIQKGKEKPAQPQVALAAGSPRIRTAHTALLRMMADKGTITSEMTFAEAEAEVKKELKYGKKVIQLPELDWYWEGTPEFQSIGVKAFREGHGLEFLLKDSDNLVRQLKDKSSTSYSRTAANYASLIAREMTASNSFNRIVARNPEKYQRSGNQLERYFGTHQMVPECFYMKVLEKKYGRPKAEEFIESFRENKGRVYGFGFQEGFDLKIINNQEGQKIILEGIHGFPDIELTPELLNDIIVDAVILDKETQLQ